MLDIKFIRENKDLVQAGAKKKHIAFDVDALLSIDDSRREILSNVEAKRAEQNKASEQIAVAKTPEERAPLIDAMQGLKQELQSEEEKLKTVMTEWQKLMVLVPNIPDMSVPEGESDEDNQEVRTWGEIPAFSFDIKSHIEIMRDLDMVDLERGAKIAGFRGYVLKNDGALLEWALLQYVMQRMIEKKFTPYTVPSLVKRATLIGTGYLPQGEEDLYKTQDGDYLSGTAEVATMGYFMDDIIPKNELPKKIVAFSPCFRREAGSHGKDTKGVFRVHEFMKLEQIVLCEASHTESVKLHEEITANAEEILQALELPYRVVVNCGADLGLGQVKKYDIEAWTPSENKYRETHSASYFHDFQTRRLNIKYKDSDGKLKFAHSLNNTAIALPRILTQIVENNQQADGSVKIPKVLQPFMGGRAVISK